MPSYLKEAYVNEGNFQIYRSIENYGKLYGDVPNDFMGENFTTGLATQLMVRKEAIN